MQNLMLLNVVLLLIIDYCLLFIVYSIFSVTGSSFGVILNLLSNPNL
jgi:hypothetical protein